jgi:hypothetical protein
MPHHGRMTRGAQIGIMAAMLLLSGCAAQAVDQDGSKQIYSAFEDAMCATNDADREGALTALAYAVEGYKPSEPDDSGASLVEAAVLDFDRSQCKRADTKSS